jgi:hypothetical protein
LCGGVLPARPQERDDAETGHAGERNRDVGRHDLAESAGGGEAQSLERDQPRSVDSHGAA